MRIRRLIGSGRACRHRATATFVVSIATLVGGCDKPTSPTPAASASGAPAVAASGSARVTNALPVGSSAVRAAVNPQGDKPYDGPVGHVQGVVRYRGPKPPMRDDVLAKIKDNCAPSRMVYGPLFRVGADGALADALVAVTGYDTYLPARSEARRVMVRDCSFDHRTLVAMFGQRFDVYAKDKESYMPRLLGAHAKAVMVAVPGGDAVKLYPDKPGRFAMTDAIHGAMFADVFVLKYRTAAVTGTDGRFEIRDVPVGERDINALLPMTMETVKKKVKVETGKITQIELEIKASDKDAGSAPAPSSAPSAKAPEIH